MRSYVRERSEVFRLYVSVVFWTYNFPCSQWNFVHSMSDVTKYWCWLFKLYCLLHCKVMRSSIRASPRKIRGLQLIDTLTLLTVIALSLILDFAIQRCIVGVYQKMRWWHLFLCFHCQSAIISTRFCCFAFGMTQELPVPKTDLSSGALIMNEWYSTMETN